MKSLATLAKDLKVRQFSVLWFVELWERYAFYSFNALFILFMTAKYAGESEAYLIYGIFASLIYITPTIGGYLSDNIIGVKRALVVGAIFLMSGYTVLALSSSLANVNLALSLIIVGNGMFKPAPTSLISKIFNDSHSQSHSAFTIYYMGINIGSFLAILFTPIVAKNTGYSYAFIICVVGMMLALGNYIWRAKLLKGVGEEKQITSKSVLIGAVACVAQLLASYLLFQYEDISLYLIIFTCALMFAYMIIDARKNPSLKDKISQILGIILVFEAIIYFVIYNQMFSTLILFAKHNVVLDLVGVSVSPATYTALDSFWIIILSPLLAIFYRGKTKHLSIPYKYCIGTMLSGVALISLYLIISLTVKEGFINGNWMILYFFFAAFAELLVSALGFSIIAIYFRKEIVTLGMGFFMLSIAAGGALSGKLGQLVAMPESNITPVESLGIYHSYFLWLGIAAFLLGVLYAFIAKVMTKLSKKHNFALG